MTEFYRFKDATPEETQEQCSDKHKLSNKDQENTTKKNGNGDDYIFWEG